MQLYVIYIYVLYMNYKGHHLSSSVREAREGAAFVVNCPWKTVEEQQRMTDGSVNRSFSLPRLWRLFQIFVGISYNICDVN